jgi:RimJ/RimL family protein N-acetyltransferase
VVLAASAVTVNRDDVGMRFILTRDVEEFAARTERLLAAHLECNVLATVVRSVLDGAHREPAPLFAIGIDGGGEGRLRLPEPDERDLLVAWMREFITEARLVGAAQVETVVDARVRYGGLLLWEDEEPACLIGLNHPVAGVVRVGPVYTPPALRRRGYASSAVAAASRRALAGGARRCMLFTDLANPTSNRIYAEVGYRRCGDWQEIALERP